MTKLILALLLPLSALAKPAPAIFPVRGPADAPVTIVMYSDFQCPYCKRAVATLDQLQKDLPADIKIVYRHFPLSFHESARPAALASVCAQAQNKFWQMHDAIFALGHGELNDAAITKIAVDTGLDMKAYDVCLKAPETDARVVRDIEEGELMGVMGTPNFFLIGSKGVKKVNGAYPEDEMKKYIEEVK